MNVFNEKYEEECKQLQAQEAACLCEAKNTRKEKKAGRPCIYKSKIAKSKTKALSDRTVAYTNARKRLPAELLQKVFHHTNRVEEQGCESWHGLHTYITDGTYLQLQDTKDIREKYPPAENNGMYPQALLQVFIRQGSGQIREYAVGSRKESELQLVIAMIESMRANDLLLADDLYNTYCHFYLTGQQSAHIIVPGKRERSYQVEKTIASGDEIVRINRPEKPPDYKSREEWQKLPKDMLLRRISYRYPTKEGMETAVLYTTLLSETIKKNGNHLKIYDTMGYGNLHKGNKDINGHKCTAGQKFRHAGKRISCGADRLQFSTAINIQPPQRAVFPPKRISFANALRLITQFCLTGKAGFSITGLRAEIEKRLTKILKHLIPKHKSNRHYPRKTKKGKYQKYV